MTLLQDRLKDKGNTLSKTKNDKALTIFKGAWSLAANTRLHPDSRCLVFILEQYWDQEGWTP